MNNLDMTTCARRCEITNRPAYIVLFKGDDSDFTGNQTIYIDIATEMDLAGYTAYFRFMDYEQTYLDITSKRLILVFPSEQTSKFPLGAADATLVITDAQGRKRTVNNRIHIVVTNSVKEAYCNEDPQAITVTVSGIFIQKQADWDEEDENSPSYIKNKPEIITTIDDSIDPESQNAVTNRAIARALMEKLDVARAYPEWDGTISYEARELVWYNGYVWVAIEDIPSNSLEPGSNSSWVHYYGNLYLQIRQKQDSLTSEQLANIAAVPGKANSSDVSAALARKLDMDSAFPEWLASPLYPYQGGAIVSHNGRIWQLGEEYAGTDSEPGVSEEWEDVLLQYLFAMKQDSLSPAQMAAVNSGITAALVAAYNGYASQIAGKADAADLRYRIVPLTIGDGQWSFTGDVEEGVEYGVIESDAGGVWEYTLTAGTDNIDAYNSSERLDSVLFSESGITATRPYAYGASLLDRASNRVTPADATALTLTLPAAVPGYMRDLIVRLTVSASSTVTWSATSGETITWDAMGAPPASFAAGTYLYRFTEVAPNVFHCDDMLALVGLEAALAGKMPQYQMVAVSPSSETLTVAPYTIATYTAGSSAEAFTVAVGVGTAGTARDCELVIDCTATDAVAPTVTWPATFHPRTDAGTDFACEAGTRNVYFISEYATGEFAVGGWQETAGGNA